MNFALPVVSLPVKYTSSRPVVRVRSALSDPFVLNLAESIEDSLASFSSHLSSSHHIQKLRQSSCESLLSKSWPSPKDEPFRFTNLSFLKQHQILPVTKEYPLAYLENVVSRFSIGSNPYALIVDGQLNARLCDISLFPEGVYVGSITSAPEPALHIISSHSIDKFSDGDLFWDLNGFGALDITVVYFPNHFYTEEPLHLCFYSSQGTGHESSTLPLSNPRCVVVVGTGANVAIVEHYLGSGEDSFYWTNSVMQVIIQEGGKIHHSYIQSQASCATHIKWTHVLQEVHSSYENVEIGTGANLSRHNLHIQQLGPETSTNLSALHLCKSNQTQDLHSRIVLGHPKGVCRQLHKCVVSHSSGHGIFDGNINVNRYAQQTDAGQLSRSLLLVPHATVNVKPNLQIIADDVKCSHGATISDLEWEPVFYFLARGVDFQTARNALLLSFAAEVMDHLSIVPFYRNLIKHVQECFLGNIPPCDKNLLQRHHL